MIIPVNSPVQGRSSPGESTGRSMCMKLSCNSSKWSVTRDYFLLVLALRNSDFGKASTRPIARQNVKIYEGLLCSELLSSDITVNYRKKTVLV